MAFVFTMEWATVTAVLDPPTLEMASTPSDPRPDFHVGIPTTALVGDVIRVQYDSGSGYTNYVAHTIVSGDFTVSIINETGIPSLPPGNYSFRARLERGGALSDWSAPVLALIDTSLPILSSPTGVAQSPTTASLQVTTNKGGGMLYWVVTSSATKPTVTQIKAGQNHTGAAALASGGAPVAAAGVQSALATDLNTAGTSYAHFVQEDASANQSLVATTASWTQVGGAWTPADLLPALWIDVSDAATRFQLINGTTPATLDGQSIGALNDKSGNAFHLTATGDDATRPTLGGLASFPYINLDGTDDKLRKVANLGLYSGGAYSLFVAARGNPGLSRSLVAETNNAGLIQMLNSNSATATTFSVFYRNDSAATIIVNAGDITEVGAWDNTDNVVGLTDDGATVISYMDGVSHDSKAYTRLVNDPVPTKFCVGAELRTTGGAFFAGRLYALIAVRRLVSDAERGRIVTWLAAKMGRVL